MTNDQEGKIGKLPGGHRGQIPRGIKGANGQGGERGKFPGGGVKGENSQRANGTKNCTGGALPLFPIAIVRPCPQICIPQLDEAGSFIAEKGLDIQWNPHNYNFAPSVQYNWERNQSTLYPLAPLQQQHPTTPLASPQPVNPSSPLHQAPMRQLHSPHCTTPNPYQPSMATLSTQDQIPSLNPNLN